MPKSLNHDCPPCLELVRLAELAEAEPASASAAQDAHLQLHLAEQCTCGACAEGFAGQLRREIAAA